MKIVNGRVFDGEGFESKTLYVSDGRFVEESAWQDDGVVLDAKGLVVAPGFIDLHFHGCMGADFCDASDASIHTIAAYEAAQGVTAICPATMTFPEEILGPVMDAAAAFEPGANEAALVGINMEGPFISPDKVGAQNPLYVQTADLAMFRRLQQRSGGLVKLVDVAPEEAGALSFIEQASTEVRISVAHTCASYDEARAAFEAGARQMTHLYNAMPGLHHRTPGPIAAAAECDDVFAELICDGIHIHPAMVRLAFKLFGPERMVLISDSLECAGLEDGEYALGGQPIVMKEGRATLLDGTIAGSSSNLAQCVKVAVSEMGIPLEHALRAATLNPAVALGVSGERGCIAPGKVADAVFVAADGSVERVIVRGKVLN